MTSLAQSGWLSRGAFAPRKRPRPKPISTLHLHSRAIAAAMVSVLLITLLLYSLQASRTTARAILVVQPSSDAGPALTSSHKQLAERTRAAIFSPQSIAVAADRFAPRFYPPVAVASDRSGFASRDRRAAAEELIRHNLRLTDSDDGSEQLELSFTNRDPALAVDVLTTVLEHFVQLCRGGASREALQGALADSRLQLASLTAASGKLASTTSKTDEHWATAQQHVQSLSARYSTVRIFLAHAQAAATYIKSKTGFAEVASADQMTIQALFAAHDQAAAEVDASQRRYGPLHPVRIAAEKRLSVADTALRDAATAFKSSAATAGGAARRIRQALLIAQFELAQDVATADRRSSLDDRTRVARRRLLSVQRQYNSIPDIPQLRARVVRDARVDRRSKGSLFWYLCLGTVTGFIAAALVVLILEYRQVGLRSPSDIKKVLRTRFAGAVPTLELSDFRRDVQPIDLPLKQPTSEFARVFRRLVWILEIPIRQEKGLSVAVCSAVANEGKTTVSICLGRSAALAGLRVVMVDCDGRRRQLSEAFEFQPAAGLVQLVEGTSSIDAALFSDSASGAHVIAYSADEAIEHSLFSSRAKLIGVVESLTKQFDLVLLDTPPLLALAEARVFADLSDQIVLVAKWRATPAKMVREALGALDNSRREMALAMLTFVKFAPSCPNADVSGSSRITST